MPGIGSCKKKSDIQILFIEKPLAILAGSNFFLRLKPKTNSVCREFSKFEHLIISCYPTKAPYSEKP